MRGRSRSQTTPASAQKDAQSQIRISVSAAGLFLIDPGLESQASSTMGEVYRASELLSVMSSQSEASPLTVHNFRLSCLVVFVGEALGEGGGLASDLF